MYLPRNIFSSKKNKRYWNNLSVNEHFRNEKWQIAKSFNEHRKSNIVTLATGVINCVNCLIFVWWVKNIIKIKNHPSWMSCCNF